MIDKPKQPKAHPVFNAAEVPQGETNVDKHDEETSGNLRNVGGDLLVDGVRKTLGDHKLHREVGRIVGGQNVALPQEHVDLAPVLQNFFPDK